MKRELIKNNWNVQAVVQQEQSKNVFEICLINANNTSESFPVTFNKNESPTGMNIIQSLVTIKPLLGKGDSAAYNIYRDHTKNRCINYIELSMALENLDLQNQPTRARGPGQKSDPRVLYFAQESEMKWN